MGEDPRARRPPDDKKGPSPWRRALFTYIDGWYNRERIQARLGWRSPDEYEHTWHISRAHPEPAPAR